MLNLLDMPLSIKFIQVALTQSQSLSLQGFQKGPSRQE